MVVKKMMQEMIVGIEIERMTQKTGKERKIETLKITTDNHGYSFVVDFEKGRKLKVGDFITVELKW